LRSEIFKSRFSRVKKLIGIEFDDNTAWGQLTILELKLLIYLALQGPIKYAHEAETVLDVIPVDQVAAGMTLSLAELLEGTHKVVYQYGSSDTSPLRVKRLIELVALYKRQHYTKSGKGNPLVNWVQTARVIYTETTALSQRDFIAAERTLGAGTGRILFRHILPHHRGLCVLWHIVATRRSSRQHPHSHPTLLHLRRIQHP
jgi:hypothetical protein